VNTFLEVEEAADISRGEQQGGSTISHVS
jgi:hypothetical protein